MQFAFTSLHPDLGTACIDALELTFLFDDQDRPQVLPALPAFDQPLSAWHAIAGMIAVNPGNWYEPQRHGRLPDDLLPAQPRARHIRLDQSLATYATTPQSYFAIAEASRSAPSYVMMTVRAMRLDMPLCGEGWTRNVIIPFRAVIATREEWRFTLTRSRVPHFTPVFGEDGMQWDPATIIINRPGVMCVGSATRLAAQPDDFARTLSDHASEQTAAMQRIARNLGIDLTAFRPDPTVLVQA